jgi:hypothetical protein
MHPHVAKRAQHEIDTVTGGPGSRMPTFADRDKLPFIDAIVTETIRCVTAKVELLEFTLIRLFVRWHPPVPLGELDSIFNDVPYNLRLGIPHRCERCDLYNEMTIPTNSTVIANVW